MNQWTGLPSVILTAELGRQSPQLNQVVLDLRLATSIGAVSIIGQYILTALKHSSTS